MKMKNLKSALGKEETDKNVGTVGASNSYKWKKNEHSDTIKSIGDQIQDEETLHQIHLQQSTQLLSILVECHGSNHIVDENFINFLIKVQSHHFSSTQTDTQKIHLLHERINSSLPQCSPQHQEYIIKVLELLKNYKSSQKPTQQTSQKKVLEFNEIADRMFKKTNQVKKQPKKKYIEINLQAQKKPKKRSAAKGSKNHHSNGTKNSGDSQDSAERKLGKLLVSDRLQKKQYQKQQTNETQTFSFSSAVSGSLKQRSLRVVQKPKNKTDLPQENIKEKDQAFIFYRPKKGKK